MTISLTCTCGARLEIDETFAGQTIHCPDCQRALSTPRPERPGMLTSGLALASLILALVGAFTLLGTILAVVFGMLALRDIARRPDQVTGKGYAVAGIALGLFLTALTGFALTSGELFGLSNLPARLRWSGKLDYPENEEVVRKEEGYAIKRPSKKWGVRRFEREDAPHIRGEDLVMVNIEEDAYLVCYGETMAATSLERCRERVLSDFRDRDRADLFGGKSALGNPEVIATKDLKKIGTAEIVEMLVDRSVSGQNWRFLIRIIKAPEEATAYVLIGGTRRGHFARVEPELRQAMDSFHTVDR